MKVAKKVPVKGKGKGKRWKKGHSSDSNPVTNKHRQAAKNRFFHYEKQGGESALTQKALVAHNQAEGDREGDILLDDDSQSDKLTYISRWTNCTNTTFTKLDRYANSSSVLHKEILAVLAAVTEVIKSKGGMETETEYFAILMSTMETVDDDDSLAAVAYLLNMVVRRVPHSVLKARFSDFGSKLSDMLGRHVDTDKPVLLRSLIACLATVLRVQDSATWNHSSTTQIYTCLLSFSSHSKPKVRKACHQAVAAILKGSPMLSQPGGPQNHPAAATTAKFCILQIEKCGGIGEAVGTLHTLEMLDKIMTCLPRNSLKSVCETVLKAMTLTNPVVLSVCMKVLHNFFSNKPSEESLPAQLNAQLIMALYDFQPRETDVQPMVAWLATAKMAHCNLSRLDEKLCLSHLPRFVTTCMTCMQSDKMEIASAAGSTVQAIIEECLAPHAATIEKSLKSWCESNPHPVQAVLRSLEAGLSYQYHAAWGLVLKTLGAFFKALALPCYPFIKKCLQSMVELRDSFHFNFKGELDYAVGMAVRSLGPRLLLKALPLDLVAPGPTSDFPHSWLLPVLRDNIQNTELAYFTDYFLPMAAKLRTMAQDCQKEKRKVEAKTYDALQQQIWSLLPSFCNQPTDIQTSFKGIAKILGTALNDRPDLRMMVMSSLRKLINQNKDNEENKQQLASFSKNFLPILFNLYTTHKADDKDMTPLAVLETVKIYLSISDEKMIATFFEKSVSKLAETKDADGRMYALLDLTIAMVPYVDAKRLGVLYQYVTPHLQNKLDRTLQKKAYRVLEEICSSKSEDGLQFVTENLSTLQGLLATSLSTSNPSSKAPRLRCLIHIFEKLENKEIDFLTTIIPEAILCTREVAERARTAAYRLLVEMGETWLRWNAETNRKEALQEFFSLMLAGLAGNPHMVAATTVALSHTLYHYKADVSTEVLGSLVEGLVVLLQSKSREVVQSGLGLLKVILSIFPDTSLAQYLPEVVLSLVAMKEAHHFRFKAKEIFTRLIRKFGYEMIKQMTPESIHKMLTNIRKTTDRAKRKKKAADAEDSDEDEDAPMKAQPDRIEDLLGDTDSELEDDAKEKKHQKKKKEAGKKQAAGVWLKEEQGDIVDFLDTGVTKKVLGTKPEAASKKPVKHNFKEAPDGRLIITMSDDESDEGAAKGSRKRKPAEAAEDDDIEELIEALGGGPAVKRKRKFSQTGLEDDDDQAPMKYQAGGSGIHRQLDKKQKEKAPGAEYKAKKARGDMKRKGKPDPYAYVPLDKKFLNKRKRGKAAGQFKSLVVGAQKGAAKGKKLRTKKK